MADHVFGYGSLVLAGGAVPCRLRGHRRVWGVAMDNAQAIPGYKRYRDPRAGGYPDVCVAFVDLAEDPRGVVEGVLLPAPDLDVLDARERNYVRTDVTDLVERAPDGRVWAYVGREDSRERLRAARAAGRAVVQRAYADAVGLEPDLPVLDLVRVDLPARCGVGSPRMGVIEGTATAEIDASIEECYRHAADVDTIDQWQSGVQRVEVVERDDRGRALVAKISTDAKVRTITTTVRFSYDEPRGLSWKQTKGDLKALDGEWAFEDLGGGRTKASYHLLGDPGRVLGMLIRGPVEGRLRELLVGDRPDQLKRRAEAG